MNDYRRWIGKAWSKAVVACLKKLRCIYNSYNIFKAVRIKVAATYWTQIYDIRIVYRKNKSSNKGDLMEGGHLDDKRVLWKDNITVKFREIVRNWIELNSLSNGFNDDLLYWHRWILSVMLEYKSVSESQRWSMQFVFGPCYTKWKITIWRPFEFCIYFPMFIRRKDKVVPVLN
jgi:hypothetical protein